MIPGKQAMPMDETLIKLQFRLSAPEHAGLFALHIESRKSLSALVREAVNQYLKATNRTDTRNVSRILETERKSLLSNRPPTL